MMSRPLSIESDALATAIRDWKSDRRPLSDVVRAATRVLHGQGNNHDASTACFHKLTEALAENGSCNCDLLSIVPSWKDFVECASEKTRESALLFLNDVARRSPVCFLSIADDSKGVIQVALAKGLTLGLEMLTSLLCCTRRVRISVCYRVYRVIRSECKNISTNDVAKVGEETLLAQPIFGPDYTATLCAEIAKASIASEMDMEKERILLKFFLILLHDDAYRHFCPELRRILIEQNFHQILFELTSVSIQKHNLSRLCLVNSVILHYLLVEPVFMQEQLTTERKRLQDKYHEQQGRATTTLMLRCLNIWFYASLQEDEVKLEMFRWMQQKRLIAPLADLLRHSMIIEELTGYCMYCHICAYTCALPPSKPNMTTVSTSTLKTFQTELVEKGLIRSALGSAEYLMERLLSSRPPKIDGPNSRVLESIHREWSLLQSQLHLLAFIASIISQNSDAALHCEEHGFLEWLVTSLGKARLRLTKYTNDNVDCQVAGAGVVYQLQDLICILIYHRLSHPLLPTEKTFFRSGDLRKLLKIYTDTAYIKRVPVPNRVAIVKNIFQTLIYLRHYTETVIRTTYEPIVKELLACIKRSFNLQEKLLHELKATIIEHLNIADTMLLADLEAADSLRQLLT